MENNKDTKFISNVLIISGPSGSGKGTIIQQMGETMFKKAVSATTRSPRSNEKDGEDYYFITVEEFKRMMDYNELYEWNEYNGKYYGTPKAELESIAKQGKVAVLDIDVNGARNIKKIYPDAASVFILLPSAAEQRKRIETRNENTEEEIIKRLNTTKEELKYLDVFDRVFLNEYGKLQETTQNVIDYITGKETISCDYENIVKNYFNK